MVAHNLAQAKQYALLKQHRYSVNVSVEQNMRLIIIGTGYVFDLNQREFSQ